VEVPHPTGVDQNGGLAPQGHPVRPPLHEGPVHRRHRQADIYPDAPLEGLPVGEDEDLGPRLHRPHRLLLQALEPHKEALLHGELGDKGGGLETGPHLLQGEGAEGLGQGLVALQDDGDEELLHPPPALAVGQGAAAQEGAGGEVLNLPLPVNGGVGHHRHRLLEELGEVGLLRVQGGQGAVVAQGADGLVAGLGQGLEVGPVPAVPAVGPLQPQRGRGGLLLHLGLASPGHRGEALAQGALEVDPVPRHRGPGGEALQHQTLVAVKGKDPGPFRGEAQVDLLPRGQGLGLGNELLGAEDPPLRGEDQLIRGLKLPKGPQAHGVGGEDRLVPVAAHDGRRALGQGAKALPEGHVEVLELLGEALDLPQDGGEDQVHGLGQGEAKAVDEAFQHAVQVLGVRAPGAGDAQEVQLPPEALNGVDLPVVAQKAKGLDLLKGGEGVGGVAVVAQGDGALELGAGELGVVALEELRRPPHLVDHAVGGEGNHVHGELGLEAKPKLPQRRIPVRGKPRHLEEKGLRAPPHRAQDLAHHLAPLEVDGAHAKPLPFLPQKVKELAQAALLPLGHEEVPHEKAGVEGQPGVMPRLLQKPRP
jgi:hypothetical protein